MQHSVGLYFTLKVSLTGPFRIHFMSYFYIGSPELQSKVEQSALLMQSNDMVLSIAGVTARLIEMYILDKGGDQGYLQTLVNTLK